MLAILVMPLVLAGCADRAADVTGSGSTDDSTPVDVPGGEALAPGLLAESWFLDDCRVARFAVKQDRDSAAEGLPPDHRLGGDGLADLVLEVLDCGALARGNRSVAAPFAMASVYTLLFPMGNRTGDVDVFVREMVVVDEAVARELSAFGFPAQSGSVEWSEGPQGPELEVHADAIDYTVQGVTTGEPSAADRSNARYYRGGDDQRLFWLRSEVSRSAVMAVDGVAAIDAGAGYLLHAMVPGMTPATWSASQETASLRFEEFRFR